MKKLYTIGEVSKLLNISTQTLRYYDKIGVVRPAYVDESTGYRKYSYDQISYIDRVRYLQDFGLSLDKIRMALENDSIENLKTFLEEHRNELQKDMDRLEETQKEIDRYIDYYSYIEHDRFMEVPFKKKEEEKWILAEPFNQGEEMYGTAGYRLTKKKNSPEMVGIKFVRQNGYLLDYAAFLKGKIIPTHYFVYLREPPAKKTEGVIVLPRGQYFCVRAKILSDSFQGIGISGYFGEDMKAPMIIADEYEDNFSNFKDCIYEIKIHI